MSESQAGSGDYSDLGFDLEKHRESIRVFTEDGFDEATVRAGLRARDLVSVRITSGKFSIGVTDELEDQDNSRKAQGCVAFEVIHQSRSAGEVQQVRADVEKYFRRHFPGRCLDGREKVHLPDSDQAKYVYVALYA